MQHVPGAMPYGKQARDVELGAVPNQEVNKDVVLPAVAVGKPEEARPRPCWRRWLPLFVCCFSCSILIAAAIGISYAVLAPKKPTWKLRELTLEDIDIPFLGVSGLVPADTSACPASDKCGMLTARGCSRCPNPSDNNAGCLCNRAGGGTSAPPGSIRLADTSKCPLLDKCGLITAKGCSTCPDSSWINDGCTCRQPLSFQDFTKGLQGVIDLLGGRAGKDSAVLGLTFKAVVDVNNPNKVGATTEAGTATISYKGNDIGTAVIEPLKVEANSMMTVPVQVKVDQVSLQVGMQMAQELLSNNMKLSVDIHGSIVAKVWLLSVKCGVSCKVNADITHQPAALQDDCSYSYST